VVGVIAYGHYVGYEFDICWEVGPPGYPYVVTIRKILPVQDFTKTGTYTSGSRECLYGELTPTDVGTLRFRVEVVINGVSLAPYTSDPFTVYP
jgi:hypothetical protein